MNENIKQNLRILIQEWQTRILPVIKPREIELGDWFRDDKINKTVSVVGFRRTGKTFLLLDFAKKQGQENCLYMNLEDERLPKKIAVLTQLLDVIPEFYGQKKLFLLLDEIQEIPDWSRWVRRVNEAGLHHLIISGSSSKLSLAQIPTELRGRTVTKNVFPLSFSEFKKWKNPSDDLMLLREYLLFGGFPEIVLADEGKKSILLDEYFQTFLLRDVFERFHLRQESAMRDLIRLVLSSPYYTFGKLANSLKTAGYNIGKGTVAKYLSLLSSSYFLNQLEIHTAKVKSRIQHPKKPYFADTFFVSRLAGNFSLNLGRLMEEAVAARYFRKKTVDPNLDLYYWKDALGREVDFVLRENLKVMKLVQVSYVSALADIPERELTALEKASEDLNCEELELITWDLTGEIIRKNKKIVCRPLNSYLLSSGGS
ncbi:MAG: hypothetical protein UX92_C0032G0002 [Candidatus Amesbacteria bacterium GW2011_GWA1_47_20]|uniref:ATPase n=1 Tax=Candidatus Amesbacteria bacterium GW2011_GWA1_47_20 TaxID=1618354 RepID=A0A0G1VBC5_9BACT|nr:MAG: hypothetical protein UX92_C0032G0002 [Candidatus Amesbacteria bacterium GW2011_GWA1_47_20]